MSCSLCRDDFRTDRGPRQLHSSTHSLSQSFLMMLAMDLVLIEIEIQREHRDHSRDLEQPPVAAKPRIASFDVCLDLSQVTLLTGSLLDSGQLRYSEIVRPRDLTVTARDGHHLLSIFYRNITHLFVDFLSKLQQIAVVIVDPKLPHPPREGFDVVADAGFVL